MRRRFKIFIVDDHESFREALKFTISQLREFMVTGEISSGNGFLEIVDKVDADIVLMDISMPGLDGITTASKTLEIRPDLKIIMLTMFNYEEYHKKMIKAGVSGYVPKESGNDILEEALRTVLSGKDFFPSKPALLMKKSHRNNKIYKGN